MNKKAALGITGGLVLLGGAGGILRFTGTTNFGGTQTHIEGSEVDNSFNNTASNSAYYTNNTTIVVSSDNFAESSALPINLSPPDVKISPKGTVLSKKVLPEKELEKIGKRIHIKDGNGATFVNGYIGVSLNKSARDNKDKNGGYATVTVQRLKPSTFNIRAGWSQEFITPYGKYSLAVEEISECCYYMEVSVYPRD